MESGKADSTNEDKNKLNSNKKPLKEKQKILSTIVSKSVKCSKATIDLTSQLLDSIMTKDKKKIISLCEKGLPDDLPELRSLIWKINLGYLPLNKEEWDQILESKRIAYQKYRNSIIEKLKKELELYKGYKDMSKEEKKALDKKTHKTILEEITKDTNRTHTEMNFFFKPVDKNNTFTEEEIIKLVENKRNCTLKNINDTYKINIILTHSDIVSRILFIYSKFEPSISYIQGMNEILAPIYYCYSFDTFNDEQSIENVEADAFWSFYNIMNELRDLFDKNQDKKDVGINGKVKRIKNMLKIIDNKLYEHLNEMNFDFSLIVFKWISLMFSQDFMMMDLLRIWDYILCNDNKLKNCYYFCLSIILMKKESLMTNKINGIYEAFQSIKELQVEHIISNAKLIENKCGEKCLKIMEEGDYIKKK